MLGAGLRLGSESDSAGKARKGACQCGAPVPPLLVGSPAAFGQEAPDAKLPWRCGMGLCAASGSNQKPEGASLASTYGNGTGSVLLCMPCGASSLVVVKTNEVLVTSAHWPPPPPKS